MQANSDTQYVLVSVLKDACPFCGPHARTEREPQDLEVEVREVSRTERGFALSGRGAFVESCPVCGMQVRALEDAIPIHAVGLTCPKCGRPDDLRVEVKRLSVDDLAIEFSASLECRTCNRRNRLTTVLRRLSELLSIEIGLTGISLKAKPKKAE